MSIMRNSKWLSIFCILLFITLISGCNSQNSRETLTELEKKITFYETENTELKNQLNELKTTKEQAVYKLKFQEAELIDIPRTMYVENNAELRAYPYENAAVINSISDKYVIVHTKVINDNREEWALVESTDFVNINNYGYVKIDKLVEKPYEPNYKCDIESISGVEIGDTVEKAMTHFGTDYTRCKSENGWSYGFKDDIYIGVDPISNTVKSILVREKGYKTEENIQVGNNAKKAVELYKSKYEMNTDEHLLCEYPESVFDLEDGYYLQLNFDTEKLTDASIITEISLFNIHDGDY